MTTRSARRPDGQNTKASTEGCELYLSGVFDGVFFCGSRAHLLLTARSTTTRRHNDVSPSPSRSSVRLRFKRLEQDIVGG